jgi:tetratricopeptide (TPR) repeat protein
MTINELSSGLLLFAKLGIDLDEVPIEQIAEYTAVQYYLTVEDDPPPDATNLDKVRRYLEAFYHLCEVEDWKRAGKILLTRLNTPTKEQLHNHLNTWGYYQEQADIYDRVLEKINEKFNNRNFIWDSNWLELGSFINIILTGLGNSYLGIGEYEKAIGYYQQRLTLARNTRDRKGEGWALANIALAYKNLRNYNQAINCLQQSL